MQSRSYGPIATAAGRSDRLSDIVTLCRITGVRMPRYEGGLPMVVLVPWRITLPPLRPC
ncbi:hypothetical protein BIW11_03322 [Tropilaelaps mercedesae]|uniref:Uncharacterized protein n=1 Tax=Tropilaelaps mercedesae TaxID=418985 RepID=A0A1V9XNN0_9ACAR|nr:hypothetical protein BIW11_03322 [Tropilaelaps mercedesae]